MTPEEERSRLLAIARAALVGHIVRRATPLPDDLSGRLGGAFVTLHKHGELRGCIGHIDASQHLAEVVRRCAVAACSADPRFPPVSAAELPHLEIELSLLGPLQSVMSSEDIELGRDGLLVEKGGRRGLLLPQVATEQCWDRETFLAQACRKAGLPPDAWKNGAAVWRFEAEVFGE
jgi:AmmeMemoRadiSam system protein A